MSENTDGNQVQFQGKDQAPPIPPGDDGKGPAPEYLTKQDFEKLSNDLLRQAQSLVDKADHRITKSVKQTVAGLEQAWELQAAAGVVIPDEAKAVMRQQAINQALLAGDSDEKPPDLTVPPAGQQVPPTDKVEAVSQQAAELMETAGIEILETDPEAEKLDHTDEDTFINSVKVQIEAKKVRLESQQRQEAGRSPGLTSGGTSVSNIANITKPGELIKMGLKDL